MTSPSRRKPPIIRLSIRRPTVTGRSETGDSRSTRLNGLLVVVIAGLLCSPTTVAQDSERTESLSPKVLRRQRDSVGISTRLDRHEVTLRGPESSRSAGDGRAATLSDSIHVPLPRRSAVALFQDETPDAESSPDTDPVLPELLQRKITDIRPSLDFAWGNMTPAELPDDFFETVSRDEQPAAAPFRTILHWAPSNASYNPLYFEDPALERYGHSYHPALQPLVSTGRFIGQAAALPYQATLHPPHSREYALGWYRPGDCAPHLHYKIPFNEEAAVTEALAVVGLVFLIP